MEEYKGAPSWIKDHLEGLDHIAYERKKEALEKEWPGIGGVFDEMIRMLPDPDNPNKSEFPFSAAVIQKTPEENVKVLAITTNRVNADNDSTHHAEMVALREAQVALGSKHLDGCALLSTAEPCLMCTGAIMHAEIKKVVYGITQEDLKDTHVKLPDHVYTAHRTTPAGVNTGVAFVAAGVDIFAGYKRKDVMRKLRRIPGTFAEYYRDPDASKEIE